MASFLKSFPVLIEGIDASITEEMLKIAFKRFGDIFSVKVMPVKGDDKSTKAFVNFTDFAEAEIASMKMNDHRLNGCLLKTSITSNLLSKKDHRKYTDCKYMASNTGCVPQNEKPCPYRHFITKSNNVCDMWKQKKCSNITCPDLHPQDHQINESVNVDSTNNAYFAELEEIYLCAVCLERLQSPRELSCQHLFCKECLEEIVTFEKSVPVLSCPQCKQDMHLQPDQTVQNIKEPLHVKQTLEMLNKKYTKSSASYNGLEFCSTIDCSSPACVYCVKCNIFFCGKCKSVHENNVLCKEFYDVKYSHSKETMSPFCKEHSCFEFKGCVDCGCIPVCVFCAEYYHTGHNVLKIDQVANKFECPIKDHLVSITEDRKVHEEMESHVATAQKACKEEEKELKRYITEWKKTTLGKVAAMLDATEKNVLSKFFQSQKDSRSNFVKMRNKSKNAIDGYHKAENETNELFKKSNIQVIYQAEKHCASLYDLYQKYRFGDKYEVPTFKLEINKTADYTLDLYNVIQRSIGKISLTTNASVECEKIYGDGDYDALGVFDGINAEESIKKIIQPTQKDAPKQPIEKIAKKSRKQKRNQMKNNKEDTTAAKEEQPSQMLITDNEVPGYEEVPEVPGDERQADFFAGLGMDSNNDNNADNDLDEDGFSVASMDSNSESTKNENLIGRTRWNRGAHGTRNRGRGRAHRNRGRGGCDRGRGPNAGTLMTGNLMQGEGDISQRNAFTPGTNLHFPQPSGYSMHRNTKILGSHQRPSSAQSVPSLVGKMLIMCYRCGRMGHPVTSCRYSTTREGKQLP